MWAVKNINGEKVCVYQKGFDGNELADYVKGVPGDGYTVKKVSNCGKFGVLVRKNGALFANARNRKLADLIRTSKRIERTESLNIPQKLPARLGEEMGVPVMFFEGHACLGWAWNQDTFAVWHGRYRCLWWGSSGAGKRDRRKMQRYFPASPDGHRTIAEKVVWKADGETALSGDERKNLAEKHKGTYRGNNGKPVVLFRDAQDAGNFMAAAGGIGGRGNGVFPVRAFPLTIRPIEKGLDE